uniref:Glycosyltransferase n=1 Tax=Carica papaya TaxID=3649 RepID=H6UM85_CARPA|nr:UDP-glucosyltransferase [Carica papaya]
MEKKNQMKGATELTHLRVLVLPFPIQGHINPMLQFAKRLLSKGLTVTLLTPTSSAHNLIKPNPNSTSKSLHIQPIDDSFPPGTKPGVTAEYFNQFRAGITKSLTDLIRHDISATTTTTTTTTKPLPKFLVYDCFMTWALDVARESGIDAAPFFTQSCAVNAVYNDFKEAEVKGGDEGVSLPWKGLLSWNDLPSLVHETTVYGVLREFLMDQYYNVGEAKCVLANSFDELENQVMNWMPSQWRIKNIGPTVPSMFLDKRLEDDKDYGLTLFKPQAVTCLTWLDSKQPSSVIYVSFGSLASLSGEQMTELARGLQMSCDHFLWVVRDLEKLKLPESFKEETSDKGLVVSWSPQLEVLAHKSMGCFMTHCGWNSTLEALSLGVPMVAMPQWTDQPTNAKFITDVWQVGIRVEVNEEGIVTREEISKCINEIMEGEKGKDIKKNSEKWRDLAIAAMNEGGSSDKNIGEFIALLASN